LSQRGARERKEMMTILQHLWEVALDRKQDASSEEFIIRGLWCIASLCKPNQYERTFKYTIVAAQTIGQGCCFCEKEPIVDESLMGKDVREVEFVDRHLEIAVLDSIFAMFEKSPVISSVIDGSYIEKTQFRTEMVVNEIVTQVAALGRSYPRIVNVGTIGNILRSLSRKGWEVYTTDFDPLLVGKPIVDNVQVIHGRHTLELVADCDVAVITGMTLATETLDDIIKVAQDSNTRLVMFAETGANFGEEYCKLGVHSVVSELFPFYIWQGPSRIQVFRSH